MECLVYFLRYILYILGLAEGFGLNLVETCLEDSVGFFTTVKDAVELFEKKDEDSVKEGAACLCRRNDQTETKIR